MSLLPFNPADVFLWCLAVVVLISLFCKAGKLIVKWLFFASILFTVVIVLWNGDKLGLFSKDALNERVRQYGGWDVYDTLVSSQAYSFSLDAIENWKKHSAPEPLPPPPPSSDPPPQKSGSGWWWWQRG